MAMYQVQMVNNVKTLVPVSGDVSTDSVTDNDMHPVTSNAVADSLSSSTTETLTGGKWIDGKPIYRKTYTGTMGTTYKDFTVPNNTNVIRIYGVISNSTGVIFPIPYYLMDSHNTKYGVYIYVDSPTLRIEPLNSQYYNGGKVSITIEYTKTT